MSNVTKQPKLQMQKDRKSYKTRDRLDLYYAYMLCGTMAAQAGYTVDMIGEPGKAAHVLIDTGETGKFKLTLPSIRVDTKDLRPEHLAIQAFTKHIIERYDKDATPKSE